MAIDPLSLLRQSITSRSDIHLINNATTPPTQVYTLGECSHLSFSTSQGRVPLPKTAPTRYTGPHGAYDLQSLLCCYLTRDKQPAQYIQEANSQGCTFVSITERKNLSDYLESKVSDLAAVQPLDPTAASASTATTTAPAPSSDAPPAKRARYVVNKEDAEEFKRIQALQEVNQAADRKTVLRGQKAVNFESVKSLVAERMRLGREEQERLRRGGHSGQPKAPAPSSGLGAPGRPRRRMEPIIIVSPSSSALITLHNVKRFLEDAVFEPPTGRGPPEGLVHVYHRRGHSNSVLPSSSSTASLANAAIAAASAAQLGAAAQDRPARYAVVDGVEALTKLGGTGEDVWDRVVCVMTTGQEWQFRPYKWSDPKELFHHVKGFFVQWTTDAPNPKVRAWNVKELRLDQSKRHIDKSAVADFWRGLEAWIALNKPFVAY